MKYYWEIALTGQVETQLPQSTHALSSTNALPSDIEIALTGHTPTHDSQPTHVSRSTFAAIAKTSSNNLKTFKTLA